MVDAFSSIEQTRLWWFRTHQTILRNELYTHISDSVRKGDANSANVGKGVILPAGYVGSKRYMQQNFQDALAVCRHVGHPDIFLTMTCNSMWDEILKMMTYVPGCIPANCPDIISRVFRLKLEQLTNDIKKKSHFGKCIGVMYVVEFQKRGLPHVHMLIWLDGASKKFLKENICCHARSIKYLFKYCLKGHDTATVQITRRRKKNQNNSAAEVVDEIQAYFDGRYVCGSEAAYRIFGFPIHHRTLSVERLPFHLPGQKSCNQIGRLSYTHHSSGEVWYLRMLLTKVRGPTSFEHLRTVNGVVCQTFRDACKEYGLLDDDKEWHDVLDQCAAGGLPPQIRQLFVHIIVNCKVTDLASLWNNHWKQMVDDILLKRRLQKIDDLLRAIGKSLKTYSQLPQPPDSYLHHGTNNLILEETNYNLAEMKLEHDNLIANCNLEQLSVYESVLASVASGEGGLFFVYGSGGCGKTYMWRTLIAKLRSQGDIVLPVASSGIAATLLPGGRTAHSRFKIPIVLDEYSHCQDPKYLSRRAILTPTNQTVSHLNSLIVDKLPGESLSYYSVDSAEEFGGTEEDLNHAFPNEYLNSINIPGMPPHQNLNQTLGLCNGTRMIITKCLRFCVECEVICGSFIGTRHFIPRMELCPSDTRMPYKLIRKQMPLQICYVMTINKSQGQSLENVGLFLPKGVFTHGQYYVAISRVTSPQGLKIFVDDDSGQPTNVTQNVVYKEMISNLRPNAATDWRLQVRLTRMWRNINRNAETVPVNFIFVDALVSSTISACKLYNLGLFDVSNCSFQFIGRTHSCMDSSTTLPTTRE
ncbi:hypothetical protein DCAR_0519759 [Daucus carota subsp. sativus]|uniref:ATP-dependent DNA helicase n=1 Tax=Daucus carota subsp. sativus TaxID=79200 RepID=A0AAF0X3B8_DAUCS|nr:hypothetical protein DCAR_0519759 [Daucus carota subsp. sativus]